MLYCTVMYYLHHLVLTACRVFKQTLKSAGGNLTGRHVEEVSLSALFLLDAAKKTDRAFGVAPQTTAHTIRDPSSDVSKMVKHLMENKVSRWKID